MNKQIIMKKKKETKLIASTYFKVNKFKALCFVLLLLLYYLTLTTILEANLFVFLWFDWLHLIECTQLKKNNKKSNKFSLTFVLSWKKNPKILLLCSNFFLFLIFLHTSVIKNNRIWKTKNNKNPSQEMIAAKHLFVRDAQNIGK